MVFGTTMYAEMDGLMDGSMVGWAACSPLLHNAPELSRTSHYHPVTIGRSSPVIESVFGHELPALAGPIIC